MKKVYSLVGVLGFAMTVTAQYAPNSIPSSKSKESFGFSKKVSAKPTAKAEGDIAWQDDFSIPSNWTIANEGAGGSPPHSAGDWAIVTALTPGLAGQAAGAGFPAGMNSVSGGNFALIDSDGAGPSATQNATITTANDIDLSALGNAALYLRFTEIYRHFQETFYVEVSNDGGSSYMVFQVNPVSEVPVNTNSADPEYEEVNITPTIAAGTWGSQVRVRFRYNGVYDWFWGIDDVSIVEAFINDVRINTYQVATDSSTTQGLDYYRVPASQTSFPGLTYGAIVSNNGAATQANTALRVTSPALSYDQTGSSVSLTSGQSDSVKISTPMMLSNTVGDYTVNVTTSIGTTDSNPVNNNESFVIRRDAYEYSRDNNIASGGIANVTSQDGLSLKVGNVMEIFNDMDISTMKIRLLNQATAVGQEIFGEIYLFNSGTSTFDFLAETSSYAITNPDLATFVNLPILGGAFTANAGDVLLVVACHNGGANEVGFGLAQPTFEQTVQGFLNDGSGFSLSSPNAVMIRLSDEPLSINETENNISLSVFPNPTNNEATVSFELANASDIVITITDLTGKTVSTLNLGNTAAGKNTVEVNTTAFASGVYTVNFTANNAVSTKKLIVRK